MDITIEMTDGEILGGREYRPHLTLELEENGEAYTLVTKRTGMDRITEENLRMTLVTPPMILRNYSDQVHTKTLIGPKMLRYGLRQNGFRLLVILKPLMSMD
jgi:hypothetical protein